jgi:hypothetical protein
MCSGVIIYIPSFINIGSGIQELRGGGICRLAETWRSNKATLFFKVRKLA